MTVGNLISNVQMLQTISTKQAEVAASIPEFGGTNTQNVKQNGFADVMNRVNSTDTDSDVHNQTAKDTHETAFKKAAGTKDNSKLSKNEVSAKDAKEITNDIKETVKDVLQVDDETLEKAMEELGLVMTDLLNPTNVATLIANLNGTNVENVMMLEELSGQFTDITNSIQSMISDLAAEKMLPVDEVVAAIENAPELEAESFDEVLTEQTTRINTDESVALENETKVVDILEETSTETEDLFKNVHESDIRKLLTDVNVTDEASSELAEETPMITKVFDESTGKEITVTMEHNVVTSEEISETQKNDASSDMSGDLKKNEHDANDQDKTVGQNLIQNLSDAISQSSELNSVDQFSTTYSTVNPTDIMDQMLEAIKVQVNDRFQSMEIQLTPENLGKINLTVVAKDGVITASITAQNEAVKSALENQMLSLKESLNNAGLKVESVEVAVESRSFDFANENGQNGNQDNAKSNARRRFRGIDELSDEEVAGTSESEILMDNNSINITA